MKLFVPEIGTRLKLTNEWKVSIQWERRNFPLIKAFYPDIFAKIEQIQGYAYLGYWWGNKNDELKQFVTNNPISVTFPTGSILEVDRIYIRKGNEKFSSLTFRWRAKGKSPRFWVPLSDVNGLECEIDGANNFEDKYPNGRFTVQRHNGFSLSWVRKPSGGGRSAKAVSVNIGDGIRRDADTIRVEKYQNNSFGKVTHYDSMDKMFLAAEKFGVPQRLIVSFIENFEQKSKPEVAEETEVIQTT